MTSPRSCKQTVKLESKCANSAIIHFRGAKNGGPHDNFERQALAHLRQTKGQDAVHDFTEIDGEPVVRYAQARIMKQSCVDCHNTHPLSNKKDWKVGDVRGFLRSFARLKTTRRELLKRCRLRSF